MNQEDLRGIEALRDAVEAVAEDLERRAVATPARSRREPGWRPAWAVALGATALLAAAVAWWLVPPPAAAEVRVLELKIRGRSVPVVVVDDRSSGGWIVMPQIPGPPQAEALPEGGR